MNEHGTIHILTTGGTIANTSGGRLGAEDLVATLRLPDLPALPRIVTSELTRVGSRALGPKEWLLAAQRVNEAFRDPGTRGVIITHGTNTMEETAYFLHLVVKDSRPVVLTAAQRWFDEASPDGPRNLADSIRVVLCPEAAGKGVLVVMNEKVQSAREATKTSRWLESFSSMGYGFLGDIDVDEHCSYARVSLYRSPTRRHTTASEFDALGLTSLPRVEVVFSCAGSEGFMVDAAVDAGVAGLVVAGFPTGSTSTGMDEALVRAHQRGVVIVRSHRGLVGSPESDVEAHTAFIGADNLTPQKARVLLMLALNGTREPAELRRIFAQY